MQGKHGLVIAAITLSAVLGCREINPYHCPEGSKCPSAGGPCELSDECSAPTPICNIDKQTCVECTRDEHCRVDAPICDTQTSRCVQCKMHTDCDSNLCLDIGMCADIADVLYVSSTGSSTMTAPCSKDMPCKLLDQALKSATLSKYIKITGAVSDTAETVIDGYIIGKPISIFGDPGTSVLTRSANGTVLSARNSANVTFVDLEIKAGAGTSDGVVVRDAPGPMVTMIRSKVSGHSGTGITLSAGSLTFIRSHVFENRTFGIDVTAGTLSLQGSWVYKNSGITAIRISGPTSMVTIDASVINGNTGTGGGLDLASTFSVTNTVITGNGDATNGAVGGASLHAQMGTFTFNTVVGNIAGNLGTKGITCAVGTRTISNSIVKNNNIDLSTCTAVMYSLTDGGLPSTTNNVDGDPKFVNTTDLLDSKFYRIGPDSAAKDRADPAAVLEKDIDGEMRPAGAKDIGADEIP